MNQDQWQLTREIFEQASQLPNEQQQHLVAEQAAGDQLVIDTVMSMLTTQTQNIETTIDKLAEHKNS